jgi:predicted esterase
MAYVRYGNRTARRARIVLMCWIVLAAGTLHAQTGTGLRHRVAEPSWKDQADELLYKKREFKAAIDLYRRWLDASPRDNASWYNLACAYALNDDKNGALDAFEGAVDAGWTNGQHARTDPDLEPIRTDRRFTLALQRIEVAKTKGAPRDYVRRFAAMRTVGTYVVALPPDYATSGKEYPICVILHGSGSSELRHGSLADSLGRDIYIAPRAPYPHIDIMHDGGVGWTAWSPDQIDTNDPAYNDVTSNYVEWIFTCIHDVQSNFRAKKGKVFIYGHSQGGHFADLCALIHPEEVAAYLAQAGPRPTKPFLSTENLRRMKAEGVRASLLHGEDDAVVRPEESKSYAEALKTAGVEYSLTMVEGDHGFNAAIFKHLKQWIANEVRASAPDGQAK